MGTNILSIGQSALAAAQAGMSTTGHNIANANTPGYTRQVITQAAALPQQFGYGFVGQGTQVTDIKRIYNEFVAAQVRGAQSTKSEADGYYSQITQINNMLADADTGVSASMSGFFKDLQTANANPSDPSARQTALSSAQTLASRFRSISSQLNDVGNAVDGKIGTTISTLNSQAQQLAKLNDMISDATNRSGMQPNDLLDQRDLLLTEMNKLVKTTVVKQDATSYNVYIGNGIPLVVGGTTTKLAMTSVPSNPKRITIGYETAGKTVALAEGSATGGELGGLLAFRSETLDAVKNKLGVLATTVATTLNAQNKLGQDLTGTFGKDIFSISGPESIANANNTGAQTISADIVDATALQASDYRVDYDGSNYKVTRLSDGVSNSSGALPYVMDGVSFKLDTTAPAAGDSFLIKPVAHGAEQLTVAIKDGAQFALASPVRVVAPSANIGTASIGNSAVTAAYSSGPLPGPVTFQYNQTSPNAFVVTPPQSVTVTTSLGSTTYASGVDVPYTDGATVSFGNVSFEISGAPADGDRFIIQPNTNGRGDNRNGLALSGLQSKQQMSGGTLTYQGSYADLVNMVGNKTHELEVTSAAEAKTLKSAQDTQQMESGVNLDEEAANLMRYQQAYQAAGKMMQVAEQMFQVLLSLN